MKRDMSENQVKFQNLLRELFQFDCADLDFGIYRVMNYKRAVIERFITEDLPKALSEELARGALAELSQAIQRLELARKKVLEALGDDALDVDGNLAEAYRNTKAGKEYLAAQQQAAGSRNREALEAAVSNHLYTFFSRYWQEGDFISRRRYSKKKRYAIPYNDEEVYLYWANHDQYHIKTGEYFTDYTYKAPKGVTVYFKLRPQRIKCIYIDPSHNTGNDGTVFKDSYQHSSWLSILSQLFTLSSSHVTSDACLFSSIDDVEFPGLRYLIQQLLREDSLVSELIWKKRGGG